MNYQDFLDSKVATSADFNIGGVRVSDAEMDFSNVSDEMLCLKGIAKIKIDLQDAEKRAAAEATKLEGLSLNDEKGKNFYSESLKARATELSGTTIDMSTYIGKPSWNFKKGVGGDPVAKASKEIEKMSNEDDLLAMQLRIDEKLKALGKK